MEISQIAILGKGWIRDIKFSPDGKYLAVATSIGVWLYRVGTLEVEHFFETDSWMDCVAFSPDGRLLASGSWDRTIKLWDVEKKKEIATLKGHANRVRSVVFSPDGKFLASGSWGEINLWDVEGKGKIATLRGHTAWINSVAFSPDGKLLASGSDRARTIKLWDVKRREEIADLEGHASGVTSVVFNPGGRLLASGSGDRTVKLWDVERKEEMATLKGHTDYVFSIAFSPDGKLLASGSGDRTVKLWDVERKEEMATLKGHTDYVFSIAFSPDGRLLASGSWDGRIKLWDVERKEEIAVLKGYTGGVTSVAFSPDGKILASGFRDGTIKLWDVERKEEIAAFKGYTGRVAVRATVVFSPDGKLLASGSDRTRTIKLWDIERKEEIATLKGHTDYVFSIAFSPDGKLLASGSRGEIKLWDVKRREEIATLRGHTGGVTSVVFSPDGRLLASGSGDRTVKLWDAERRKEIVILKGHTDYVFSIVFSPDGRLLASGSRDRTIKLWDVERREEIATLKGHTGGVTSVVFSPDGRLLASGSGDGDKTIKLWDVKKREEIITLEHTSSVFSVVFSLDGRLLASGAWDGTVRLWDVSGLGISPTKDITPPQTTISFSGREGEDGWYISDVTVTLSASDDLSGVKVTRYRIGSGRWKEYTKPFVISSEGVTKISYYSEDNAGNEERVKSLEIKVDKTSPTISHTVQKNWRSGSEIELSAEVKDVSNLKSVVLRYKSGGEVTFEKVEMRGEGESYTARLKMPRDGLVYYFEAEDALGNTGKSRLFGIPAEGDFEMKADMMSRTFHMVSVPITDLSSLRDAFSPAWGDKEREWVVGRWNGYDYDRNPTFQCGWGYWVNIKESRPSPTIHGTTVNPAESYTVELRKGWNQIGNPFPFPVYWGNVKVSKSDGEPLPILESGELVRAGFWFWRDNTPNDEPDGSYEFHSAPDDVLVPWLGYWVKALQEDVRLIISPSQEVPKGAPAKLSPLRWHIELVARDGHTEDRGNLLGVADDAKAGDDPYDVEEPPPPARRLDISFVRGRDKYSVDIRPEGDEMVWELLLTPGERSDEVVVGWKLWNLPDRYHAYLEDLDRGVRVEMREGGRYNVRVEGERKRMRVRVTENRLGMEISGVIPRRSELMSLYPNPANPEVWIPFALSESAEVEVRIYDIKGGLVRRLILGRIDAGVYLSSGRAVHWDGRNELGERVASGVYLVELRAGKLRFRRKLSVMK
jgi:WD40 repeat protein